MNNLRIRTRISPLARHLGTSISALLIAGTLTPASAQEHFKSPDDAVAALVKAVRSEDTRDMISVLGRDGREIVFSGDDVADAKTRSAFLIAYDLRHQIVKDGSKAVLQVGPNDWSLPIPIVENGGSWQFDTAKGREEILYRRIGRNELAAIRVSLAYVDAQNDYASMNPEHATIPGYAQHIISSYGKKDGLYWPTSANEQRSPLGQAAALATIEGYRPGDTPTPYHGYYYKILTSQGASAPGGAANYVVDGNMIGGFALVAYPADYGNSGVMTFLVNHAGTVFQKDLGSSTASIASRMTAFNPDHTWKKVAASDLPN